MWMLEKIEKHYGLNNVFRIADIDTVLEHYRNDKLVDSEQQITHGLYRREADGRERIYLNRDSLLLPTYRVDKWDSGNLTLNDLRMMLKNLETVAHELAHLMYQTKDNTKEPIVTGKQIGRAHV